MAETNKRGTLALTAGIFIILIVLLVNAIISYRNTRRLVSNNQWVRHTFEVISELDQALSLLKDVETGQRGYLITHESAYLQPYNDAVNNVNQHVDRLADLTADNTFQQQRLPQLRQLITERIQLANQNIEWERTGKHADAVNSVVNLTGKDKMDQVRQLVAEMRGHEEQLLRERIASSQRGLRSSIITFVVATLVAVLFVLTYYLIARRELFQSLEAARAIKERELWLHTTLKSIGDAVIATDRKGAVKFLNGVAENLTGYQQHEAEGMPISQIFPIFNETTRNAVENPVDRVLELGLVVGLANHTVLQHRLGYETPIEDSAAPIKDENGEIVGVVLVFRDVTQQRQAQESARKSEKLAAAGRLAATIAHEINNPLEAVTNLLFLARTTDSLVSVHQYLASAEQELSRVAHITRQTLGFVRATASASETRISILVDEVLMVYSGRIRVRQIKVIKNFAGDAPIKAYRGDLVQILSNLISNALDAMEPEGTLQLNASAVPGGIEFQIHDNGSGIPLVNQKRVFDAFFTTKTDVGTGLGLWVVKDLLEKFGGAIEMQSSTEPPNRGTKFTLFIPSVLTTDALLPEPKNAAS